MSIVFTELGSIARAIANLTYAPLNGAALSQDIQTLQDLFHLSDCGVSSSFAQFTSVIIDKYGQNSFAGKQTAFIIL